MADIFLQDLWRRSAGLPELNFDIRIDYARLKDSKFSKKFVEMMQNRLNIGTFRYGEALLNADKFIPYMKTKIKLFIETGNDELLVDIANYAMLEFRYGKHPNKHFKAIDRSQ